MLCRYRLLTAVAALVFVASCVPVIISTQVSGHGSKKRDRGQAMAQESIIKANAKASGYELDRASMERIAAESFAKIDELNAAPCPLDFPGDSFCAKYEPTWQRWEEKPRLWVAATPVFRDGIGEALPLASSWTKGEGYEKSRPYVLDGMQVIRLHRWTEHAVDWVAIVFEPAE